MVMAAISSGIYVTCYANSDVSLQVPTSHWGISVSAWPQISSTDANFIGYIQLVVKYLRIALVIVSLAVLIYGGFRLITQGGEKMKDTGRLLLGLLVGILIAVFSYAIVKLLTNLF